MSEAITAYDQPPLGVEAHRQTFGDFVRSEEGSASRRAIAGVAAGVLTVAALVGLGVKYLHDHIPEQVGTSHGSVISAREIKLVPEQLDCNSLSVYDTSGSTAHTIYQVGSTRFSFTGYGADMVRGKVIKEGCAERSGVTITDSTDNGKAIKLVKIKRSAIVQSTRFNPADTEILPVDPPLTQAFGGGVDLSSGLALAACEGIAKLTHQSKVHVDGKTYDCRLVEIVANWNHQNQAKLAQSLEVEVAGYVQKTCGAAGWGTEQQAFADSYKLQAAKQHADPNTVRVEIVDDAGQPTSQPPDFSRSTLDQLYKDGTLRMKVPGAPKLQFEKRTCEVLSQYHSKYPANK